MVSGGTPSRASELTADGGQFSPGPTRVDDGLALPSLCPVPCTIGAALTALSTASGSTRALRAYRLRHCARRVRASPSVGSRR